MVKLSEVSVGKEFIFEIGPEKKEWYVEYAKTSGDKNPIHRDHDYAVKVGLKGVISHGLLSLAIMSRFISDLAEDGKVIEISGEMRGSVRAADMLINKIIVESIDGNQVSLKFEQFSITKVKIEKDGVIVKKFEAEEAGWVSEKDIERGFIKTEETPEGTLTYRERLATPGTAIIELID
ncbi:MAG: hypothetical protein GY870_19640 [archaeon]|nr:hypothetical protein [archaeon]